MLMRDEKVTPSDSGLFVVQGCFVAEKQNAQHKVYHFTCENTSTRLKNKLFRSVWEAYCGWGL